MSEDYGRVQTCPRCSGALRIAERRMHLELDGARDARSDAREMARTAVTESRRARNADPQHLHASTPGRRVEGACTLAWHRTEASRADTASTTFVRAARRHERNALVAAQEIAAAGRRLLEGCDLCGRGPLPANGRVAA